MGVTEVKDGPWIIISGGSYAETIEYLHDYGITADQVHGFWADTSDQPTVLIKKGV